MRAFFRRVRFVSGLSAFRCKHSQRHEAERDETSCEDFVVLTLRFYYTNVGAIFSFLSQIIYMFFFLWERSGAA